jgi:hypothetical protein
VSTESTSEEKKGDLEHYWKTSDEKVEGPFLEPIAFSLTVTATLDHRPTRIPQVPVQPLFPQHRDECSKQRDQEACVHKPSDGDDLAGRILLGGRNGGGYTRDSGLVEGEKNGAKEGC